MTTDKKLILSKLKLHYGLKTDAEFARFLEIKPQTLASWYTRNSFDIELLYAKCVDIDPDWLLSGRGEMLRNIVNQDKLYVTALENEIRNLKETVRSYEAELHHKNREILDKNELLKQKDATITIHEKVIIAQEKTIASQELLMGKMIDKEIIPPLIDQAIENDYFGISTNAN